MTHHQLRHSNGTILEFQVLQKVMLASLCKDLNLQKFDCKKYLVLQEFLFLRERDVLRLFQDLCSQYHHQLDHLFAVQKILLLC